MPGPTASQTLENLGLLTPGRPRGRPPGFGGPPKFEVIRDLYPEDLEAAEAGREIGPTYQLARLRHHHHLMARLVADGKTSYEISAVTGHHPVTIRRLSLDPMFKDLVAHYRSAANAEYLDVHKRLANLGISALEALQSRLVEDEDSFTTRELQATMEIAFDRSVAPSKAASRQLAPAPQGSVNLNISFGKDGGNAAPMPITIEGTKSSD